MAAELSFQSNLDSAPTTPPPILHYKFVTGSPADWTAYELAIFKDGLIRFPPSPIYRRYHCHCYGKESRGRKPEEFCAGKTIMDMKEKVAASTSLANFQIAPPNNVVPFSMSMHYPGQNSLVTNEVPILDNTTQLLLEQNIQLLSQISANIETFKLGENMDLFLRTNNNIRTISKRMSETPGIMGQMRPLPVPVNETI